VDVIGEGTEVGTAYIDSIGAELTPGPDLYGQVVRNLATAIADC